MRRFLDFPVQAHLERALRVQRCPTIASVPSSGPYATQGETPKESVAPCPWELTGENSPHLYRGVFWAKSLQEFSILVHWTSYDLADLCGLGVEAFAFSCRRKRLKTL
jgi:hypothetical protein